MKKLFISQPMNGKTEDEILRERAKAVKAVECRLDEPIELIDSILDDAPNDAKRALWMLGKSIQLLSTADIVCFVEGWETARGCKVEHQCAIDYEIDIITA